MQGDSDLVFSNRIANDLDLSNLELAKSDVYTPMESQCRTFYFIIVVMFDLSVTINTVEIYFKLTLNCRMGQGQM